MHRARHLHGGDKRVYPGGMSLVVRRVPALPLVAVRCLVRGGSIAEWPHGGGGTAHLLEHVFATVAAERMHEQGLGALLNAQTCREFTAFNWSVLPEDLETSLACFLDTIDDPEAALATTLSTQRRIVAEEIRLFEADAVHAFRQGFLEEAFERHPIRHPVCGYPRRLERAGVAELTAYAERVYCAPNLHLVAVGDLDPERLAGAVGRLAEGTRHGCRFHLDAAAGEPDGVRRRAFRMDPDQTRIAYTQLGVTTPGLGSPDALAFEVLARQVNTTDGCGLRHRLLGDGVADDLVAVATATPFGAGHFTLLARHAPGQGERVQAAMERWLERVADGDELAIAHRDEGRRAASSHSLAGWAQLLGLGEVRAGDPLHYELHGERLAAVTGEAISGTVSRHLAGGRLTVGRLEPGRAHRTDVLHRPSGSRSLRLPNGARLLALPTPNPLASCQVLWRGGVLAETARTGGVASLMARLLPHALAAGAEEGLAAYARRAGAEVFAFGDPIFCGLSLTAPAGELLAGLELLAATALRPVYTSEVFERLRRRTAEWLAGSDPGWSQVALGHLRRALYPRHPFGRDEIGSPASLAALSLDDVVACHRRLAVGENTVVVVAGELDPGRFVDRLAELFDATPGVEGGPFETPAVTPLGRPRRDVGDHDRGYACLGVGYSGVAWERRRWHALELARTLLVGPENDAVTGRLVRAVRASGSSYGLRCHHEAAPGEGYLAITAACAPGSEEGVVALIEAEIERLRTGEIEPAELAHWRKLHRLSRALTYESSRNLAYAAGRCAFLSGEIRAWEHLDEGLESIRVEEVAGAASRHLVPAAEAIAIRRPASPAGGVSTRPTDTEEVTAPCAP